MLQVYDASWVGGVGERGCGGWHVRVGEEVVERSDRFGVLRKSRGGVILGGGWGSVPMVGRRILDMKTRASGVLFFRWSAPVLGLMHGVYGISMGGETEA